MGNYQMVGRHTERTFIREQRLRGKFAGIELEVQNRRGVNHLLSILPDPPRGTPAPSTERDGSLDHNGVEIVFPPLSYNRVRHPKGFVAKLMATLRAEQDNMYYASCGMHININTADWDRHQVQAFCAIINWLPRTWLERVGGRDLNDYCAQLRSRYLDEYNPNRGRYATAVRHNYSRVECRFPKATSDHNRLTILMDFLECVEEIAKNKTEDVDRVLTDGSVSTAMGNLVMATLSSSKSRKARRVKEVLNAGYQEVNRAA